MWLSWISTTIYHRIIKSSVKMAAIIYKEMTNNAFKGIKSNTKILWDWCPRNHEIKTAAKDRCKSTIPFCAIMSQGINCFQKAQFVPKVDIYNRIFFLIDFGAFFKFCCLLLRWILFPVLQNTPKNFPIPRATLQFTFIPFYCKGIKQLIHEYSRRVKHEIWKTWSTAQMTTK